MAKEKASLSTKKSTDTKTTVKAVSSNRTIKAIPGFKSIVSTLKGMPIVGIVIAEFVGTFLLVAYLLTVQTTPLYVAFALVGIVLMTSRLTSVHLNPAMTVGALVTRKISAVYALGHILAQILGAIVAWLVLDAFAKGSSVAAAGTTAIFHVAALTEGKEWYVFYAELLGTMILAFGFAAALKAKKDKLTAAMAYGFAALVALIIVGSVTSLYLSESNTGLTFLNPAAVIAANGLSWNVWPIAIYIVAPVLGGIAGIALYDFMQVQPGEDEK